MRAALGGGRVWVGGAPEVTFVRRFWKIPQWDGPNISFQLMGPEGTAGPVPEEGQAGCQGQVLPPEGFGALTRLPGNGHTASPLPLKERGEGERDGGE